MDAKTLEKHIASSLPRQKNALARFAYYDGKHPAIYSDAPKEAPDNRVPVPLPRKAVKEVMGYMFRSGDISYAGSYYDSTLKPIFDGNEEAIVTPELAETALIHGQAFELHWMEDGQHFAQVPIAQCVPIYSDDLVPALEAFIRHWIDSDQVAHAVSYDDSTITEWQYGKQGWYIVSERAHGYKSVPVVEYTIARDKSNLFDHVLPLVDLLDQSISEDVANELQRFANAYLMMADDIDATTADENGETELDKIKRTRVFANLREDVTKKIAFLQKTIDPTFINTALDRTERLIYEMLCVPNPSDDVFNAQSGIALEYKLQPFEYLCSSIQTYFTRALQQRIRLIGNLDTTINGDSGNVSDVEILWHRNKPDDVGSLADIAAKLKGVLSDETIVKLFPAWMVEDANEEMERLEAAKPDMTMDTPIEDTPEGAADSEDE